MVDATSIRRDRVTGIERYTQGVIRYLPHALADWAFVVIVSTGTEIEVSSDVRVIRIPTRNRIREEQVELPRALRHASPTVAFFPGLPPPLYVPPATRTVAQIHDAAIWQLPDTLSRATKLYYKPVLELSLRRRAITAVITSSRAAEREVRDHLPHGLPVYGIPPGVAMHGEKGDIYRATVGETSPPYALAVGTVEPRKNYGTLLRAWQILTEKGMRIPLKIVGRRGWGEDLSLSGPLDELVEFVGAVSDESLAQLYRGCRLFVMPSMYEGFGVPVVEAMLRGRRCVVSDIPVFREIGGSTLRYVSTFATEEWASAVGQAWLEAPEDPYEPAVARAQHFTWERCAEAIARVIRIAATQ